MLGGALALVVASLFTGAAVYIHAAEQPARLRLNDEGLLQEWKLAYPRGYAMQAPLAVMGFLLGAWVWYRRPHRVPGRSAVHVGELAVDAVSHPSGKQPAHGDRAKCCGPGEPSAY